MWVCHLGSRSWSPRQVSDNESILRTAQLPSQDFLTHKNIWDIIMFIVLIIKLWDNLQHREWNERRRNQAKQTNKQTKLSWKKFLFLPLALYILKISQRIFGAHMVLISEKRDRFERHRAFYILRSREERAHSFVVATLHLLILRSIISVGCYCLSVYTLFPSSDSAPLSL